MASMVRTFTAAVHEEDDWYGTLASILRQAGLTPAEFLKLLSGA
jgi:hypothetical protein